MPNPKEKQFYDALKAIFVGAKVEGQSGYINLMAIKNRYFEQGIFPILQNDIETALQPFPDFREELFDKLYAFFYRYFSESGSIYFRHTPFSQSVYEKVYTDDQDVILFWKTRMLYYVKTDRLFKSLEVEVEGEKFFFDVSTLVLKKSNEKREILYNLANDQPIGKIAFRVSYTERGRKTNIEEILRVLQQNGHRLSEEMLEKAFITFERQSEVDYFINKNARAFLEEQLDLWLYQYVFSGQNVWSETRIKQIQSLKSIALKIIAFISQFEDELVKIWNKPKFVLNAHYIITLDKLSGSEVIKKILVHPSLDDQVQEWRDQGMLEENFKPEMLSEKDFAGAFLYPRFQYLPLDTKYFKDLELEILTLFEDLDAAVNGWLVHSDNYQALNSMSAKFQGRVQCIHIDPPYNTNSSGFLYVNDFGHSSWLSMMFDRVLLSKKLLSNEGVFTCHIDEYEFERLNILLDEIGFKNAGTMIWDKGQPVTGAYGLATQHEYIIWRTISHQKIRIKKKNLDLIQSKAIELVKKYNGATPQAIKEYRQWLKTTQDLSPSERTFDTFDDSGKPYRSDNMSATDKRTNPKFYIPLIHPILNMPCPVPAYGWRYSPESMKELLDRNEILFGEDNTKLPRKKTYLSESESSQLPSMYRSGSRGKQGLDDIGLSFPFAHNPEFYEYILRSAAPHIDDIILDFFAGSGTTAHAVIDLNQEDNGKRKYILVEMGTHFYTTLIPRVKKAVFSDNWKEGKANDGKGISHFVKYFDLEQYEDVLRCARYQDADLFNNAFADPYNQYIFLKDVKLLDGLTVDLEQNKVTVRLDQLYSNIDLVETLSNLTGKWIKRVLPGKVIFEDGEEIDLTDIDYRLIKPLIWW